MFSYRKNEINFWLAWCYLIGYNQPVATFGNGIGAEWVNFLFRFCWLPGIQFVLGFTNRTGSYQAFQIGTGKMGGEAAASGTRGVETGKMISIWSIDNYSVSFISQRITCVAVCKVSGAVYPGRFASAADGDNGVPDRNVGNDVVSSQFTGIFIVASEIQK